MTLTPQGDLFLDSQGDSEVLIVRHPDSDDQTVLQIPLTSAYGIPQIDGTGIRGIRTAAGASQLPGAEQARLHREYFHDDVGQVHDDLLLSFELRAMFFVRHPDR